MSVPKETIWELEPHTLSKHKILESYLKAWFPIIGSFNNKIIYIDGFAGPGIYSKGEPGSPIIALNVANEHKSDLKGIVIFLFIEESADRFNNLEIEIKKLSLKTNFKVYVENGKFHEVIEATLLQLEGEGKILAPTFAFIDPFGFSGVPAALIGRLLKNPRVEVFINFAVDSINRFIGTKEGDLHIGELFGTPKASEILKGHSINRSLDLRDAYQSMLKTLAKFVRYFEMKNNEGRPIYYLFFASNNRIGHLKMKEVMWHVDKEGDFNFSDATNPNQIVLFEKVDFGREVFDLIKEKYAPSSYDVEIFRFFIEDNTAFLKSI